MILAVAATEMEAASLRSRMGAESERWALMISGVGILETAARLGQYLAQHHRQVKGVLQFGVGGAYIHPAEHEQRAGLLSLCLAEQEFLGDLGVEVGDELEYFSSDLVPCSNYPLSRSLLNRATAALSAAGLEHVVGNFVTVNCASGTRRRGESLRRYSNGLCENMEGAAAARVCALYDIPMLEIRVISNMVEDRNLQNWQLSRACEKAGETAALLLKEFL
ncbi:MULTISPECIES: futalosine hydrolase [Desulfosediminicola]|uniref:futalosine hydrolase n=1 Tax=Desulfosediminicola TaxID=2886823 RepID=UPI0010AC9915|nr:futalosine hydrolase [Desulfosediminicola ganghwensis]